MHTIFLDESKNQFLSGSIPKANPLQIAAHSADATFTLSEQLSQTGGQQRNGIQAPGVLNVGRQRESFYAHLLYQKYPQATNTY